MTRIQLADRHISFHPAFVDLTGSIRGALLLSQAVYWQSRTRDINGWFYKRASEWNEETRLTRKNFEGARRECAAYLEYEARGIPRTTFYRVKLEALETALAALIVHPVEKDGRVREFRRVDSDGSPSLDISNCTCPMGTPVGTPRGTSADDPSGHLTNYTEYLTKYFI